MLQLTVDAQLRFAPHGDPAWLRLVAQSCQNRIGQSQIDVALQLISLRLQIHGPSELAEHMMLTSPLASARFPSIDVNRELTGKFATSVSQVRFPHRSTSVCPNPP